MTIHMCNKCWKQIRFYIETIYRTNIEQKNRKYIFAFLI